MTAQDHAEPMLPDAANERSQTPYEAGLEAARADQAYDPHKIPTKHRRSYARGFARGCVEQSRINREDCA